MPAMLRAILAVCLALQGARPGEADEVGRLLDEIKATWTFPAPDPADAGDPGRVAARDQLIREILNRRVDLIGRFHRLAPGHRMDRELMMKRWAAMMGRPLADRRNELVAEVGAIADDEGNPLRVDAAWARAWLALPTARDGDPAAALRAVDAFIALAPKDDRGPRLLAQLAAFPTTPPERREAIRARIAAEYPDFDANRGRRPPDRKAGAIGKPFDLAFTDAVSGAAISLPKDWKGKVVVVDFWATSCGPCVAETPGLKALYEKYRDAGVRFVGVSLGSPDDGLPALRAFVQEHRIEWPQFHGEKALEFAEAWGVEAVPTIFVVDRDGRLHSTDARGKLASILPELLR